MEKQSECISKIFQKKKIGREDRKKNRKKSKNMEKKPLVGDKAINIPME